MKGRSSAVGAVFMVDSSSVRNRVRAALTRVSQRGRLSDVAMLAFIAVLVIARSIHRDRVVDIHLWDETLYLRGGVELLRLGLPVAEWAPLYSVWYWLESLFIRDRIALYYVNWSLLLAANLVVAWLIMRKLGIGLLVTAVAVAGLALASAYQTVVNVPMLASSLVGIAVLVALGQKTMTGAFATAATALVPAAFVRPELSLAFGVVLVAGGISAIVERSASRLALPIAVAAAALFTLGNPLSSGRSVLAFAQHYAKHANDNAPSERRVEHPDLDWERVLVRDFGEVETVADAIRANPRAFFWHVEQNARALVPELVAPVVLGIPGGRALGWGLLVSIAVGVTAALRRRDRTVLVVAVIAASALAAEGAGMMLVFPNAHYMAVPVLAVVALGIAGTRGWRPRHDATLAAAAAVLLLAVLPGQTSAAPWYLPSARIAAPPGLAVARSVGALHGRIRGFTLLAQQGNVGVYSDWDSDWITFDACPVLSACLQVTLAIIVEPGFIEYYSTRQDPLLPWLLSAPALVGFTEQRVLGPDYLLLARPGVFEPRAE